MTRNHACGGPAVRASGRVRAVASGLVLLGVLAAAPPATAQSVRGIVSDGVTGAPIALATVTLVAATGERLATFLTTDEGFFSLETDDPGPFLVRATALGYAPARAGPLEMTEGSLQVVELRMTAAPIGIEGLVVEGEGRVGNYLTQKGFWERYQEGRGQFLTPGEVVASDAMFTPHLLRGLKHIVPQYGAAPWAVWPMLGITEARACEPRIFVDGVWVNRPEFGLRETLGLDDIVPIERITAVEVYNGPFQAPILYQGTTGTGGNSCGVILFWTG